MFSSWRCLYLHATITTFHQISRVTHTKDGPVSLWTLRKNFQSHGTIQQRHKSRLVKKVRHGGFRTSNGIFVKPGDTVELEDGNFLRVKEVLHNEFYDKYWIVGWRFVRNKGTLGLSGRNANEVFWVVHLAKNNSRPAAEQALMKVDGSQILRKRTMTMVNTTHLDCQKRTGADHVIPGDGALVCRWKHVILTETGKRDRPLNAFEILASEIMEASFQRLRAEDCDDGHNDCTMDETLRQCWLGVEERGSADIESKEPKSLLLAVEALSLDYDNRGERVPAAYTFADVCCGAGGASRGAEIAGFQLRWALDHNAAACETFRLNFPQVTLYHKPLKDVVQMGREGLKVDVLHISPPCQAFSPAHTSPNLANDTVNIAANMEIGTYLDAARPRIATLEQTSGLMSCGHASGRHSEHWGKLIEQFTSRGYSVAWKNADLAELDLPQPRKRLIMIASCPGEPLPHFPQPTHTRHPNSTALKPFTSVKDAISKIPPGWPDHSPPPPLKTPRAASNENAPLPNIVMTHRSSNTHPSGLRTLSLRELACLQGFPLEHRFARAGRTMTQIGNAFPPTVAAVLYDVYQAPIARARWT